MMIGEDPGFGGDRGHKVNPPDHYSTRASIQIYLLQECRCPQHLQFKIANFKGQKIAKSLLDQDTNISLRKGRFNSDPSGPSSVEEQAAHEDLESYSKHSVCKMLV
ncbi:hypothetical protein U9M48_020008 [Paspalum notatum var. saurae]|uniref:Uncharacterized protein n=1 Tax=Paspalum notatum var. saurae TaxID=547442 RepID=A0AAQ3TDI3_PASNO